MNTYQSFIHRSRYARWLPEEQRRETWEETVRRYIRFMQSRLGDNKPYITTFDKLEKAIINMEVMPSMRAMMTAGPALARDNVAGYNCAYLAINRVRAFDELMYILLCGTGVGFSVERQYINQFPEVSEEFFKTDTVIKVADSKVGWAKATKEMIYLLYSGQIPKYDVSNVRPAGSRLKTFGGRASGPEPLVALFERLIQMFQKAAGRKLNSLEVHDICCHIADAVVVGGVRRSALISLSNLSDHRMANAKNGEWYHTEGQRANANNSVAYTEKPDFGTFTREWLNLYDSKSGERGIFNRVAANAQAARNGRREEYEGFGTNPCSEIILRDRQFCNLTECIIRPTDTLECLKRKVRLATILGTIQATLTDFRYLSNKWKENCEEERLLGVSLTGIMDHPVMSNPKWTRYKDRGNNDWFFKGQIPDKNYGPNGVTLANFLKELKDEAININKEWAKKLGINQSVAITCVKPSGTVSQLVGCSSGIHPAQYRHYYRTVRQSNTDPLTKFLIDQGVKYEPDATGKPNTVFYFPVKVPDSSTTIDDISAIEQLELWKVYQDHWCEHKPSCTVYIKEEEWMDAGAWVYKHFDEIAGVSFFPLNEHIYKQAPYISITEEQYNNAVNDMPEVDWSGFNSDYESDDNTISSQEFACVGMSCEI